MPGLARAGLSRLVTVEYAPSLSAAYEVGHRTAQESWPGAAQLYIHQDTELLLPGAGIILERFLNVQPSGTMVGAIGTTGQGMPWWAFGEMLGDALGSPVRYPVQEPTPTAMLDGIAILQSEPWLWTPLEGWHGYDANRSLETYTRGLPLWVHPALRCHHRSTYKGHRYHREHIEACLKLATRWRLPCAYEGRMRQPPRKDIP